jgi:short-subunit dehydrogenase
MTEQDRPLALVTGASSGIGLELAKQFASNGYDLIICAEDSGLDDAARELSGLGAHVEAVHQDLRKYDEVENLYKHVQDAGRPLAAAALNAGVGQGGPFVETDLADEQSIIDLNVSSTVHLAKLVLKDMTSRDSGKMLITSSIAATMPGSHQAIYNASKAFLQSFAAALNDELTDSGVTVTSLMPGPTQTNFFERAGMGNTRIGRSQSKDDPAQVAKQGFEAMEAGQKRVVAASLVTKAQERVNSVLPDMVKAKLHGLMAR